MRVECVRPNDRKCNVEVNTYWCSKCQWLRVHPDYDKDKDDWDGVWSSTIPKTKTPCVESVLDALKPFLAEKNKRYGNSIYEPLEIFAKHATEDKSVQVKSILVRLDDKLKRVKNADQLRKNDLVDITGYLVHLLAALGHDDFTDLLD